MVEEKIIVCFGDSNTHGYNNKTGGRFDRNTRWPMVLQKLLGEPYGVKEEGMSGRTTVFCDPLNEAMSGLDAIRPVLFTHEPVSLLIIMLGTNDVKERFSATPENIARGLDRLLKKAKAANEAFVNHKANILVIAPYPIDEEYRESAVGQDMGKGCAEKSRALPALFERVALQNRCHFLSATEIPGMENYPYDYMHLSPKAHSALAEVIAKKMGEYLS